MPALTVVICVAVVGNIALTVQIFAKNAGKHVNFVEICALIVMKYALTACHFVRAVMNAKIVEGTSVQDVRNIVPPVQISVRIVEPVNIA